LEKIGLNVPTMSKATTQASLFGFYVTIPTLPERVEALQEVLRDKTKLRNDDTEV